MRRARFLTSAASILTIAGGALLLGTPRQASAFFVECTFRQLETGEEVILNYCEYGGDADLWCNPDGSMAMVVYCYN
jgi:hypothetical protein